MKAIVAITLTAGLPVALASAIMNKRIISPDESTDRYKFTVSIQNSKKSHLCGGMLLDSTTVLTAAHCLSAETDEGFVVAGKMNLAEAGGVTVKISTIQQPVHETVTLKPTTSTEKMNDIAILKLATPIEKNDKIEYAMLPKSDADLAPNSAVVAVGWGNAAVMGNTDSAIATDKRAEATIPLQPMDKCSARTKQLGDTSTLLCAGKAGKTVCKGDSGGPLIDSKTGALVGLTSHDYPDSQNLRCNGPTIFTKVGSYLDFINSNLGQRGYTGGENQRYKDEVKLESLRTDLKNACAKHYVANIGTCRQPIDKKFGAVNGELAPDTDDATWDAYEAETSKCFQGQDGRTKCDECAREVQLDWKVEQVVECADKRAKKN